MDMVCASTAAGTTARMNLSMDGVAFEQSNNSVVHLISQPGAIMRRCVCGWNGIADPHGNSSLFNDARPERQHLACPFQGDRDQRHTSLDGDECRAFPK